MHQDHFIYPDWPAPSQVRAVTTTRQAGASAAPYDRFNLADHVGDAPEHVATNRAQLRQNLKLPSEPLWLTQVHETTIVDHQQAVIGVEADGSYSNSPGQVCAVLTADCLPILLCNREGDEIAALHAGWRGLASGIISKAVARMKTPPEKLLAWLGPAIGPEKFEVGRDVYDTFVGANHKAEDGFTTSSEEHWLADLYFLARLQFQTLGVEQVFGGDHCTFSEKEKFYSYRRDGTTGRMASLIWIEN